MRYRYSLVFIVSVFLFAAPPLKAQTSDSNPEAVKAVSASEKSGKDSSPGADLRVDQVLDRIVEKETALVSRLAGYTPLVETYIQDLADDKDLGAVPKGDHYFIGKLDLTKGVTPQSLLTAPGFAAGLKNALTQFYSIRYLPEGFAQMILIDGKDFNRSTYDFEYVRREFLGQVKCLVFDVMPKAKMKDAHFQGRIWVEDQDFNIVRFNGTYNGSSLSKLYFHFDSWREQMGPGLWLPAYVYTEESDMPYFFGRRHLRFKGQTRLFAYNVGKNTAQNELTAVMIDDDKIEDNGDADEHMSPVLSLRAWERQAEDNVLQRLQKAGLLAREGEVEKVLNTVVSNLEITNNLEIAPQTRVRVLLTSPLESFTVGHTIILSRGLIDVLPDEASLAMVLAHELGHIALGHRLDTKYAFNDRMLFDDTATFNRLNAIKRDKSEETAADQKAMQFLQNSPYKDKLGNAGLFLRALNERSADLPNLLSPHMGNPLAQGNNVKRMAGLMNDAPALQTRQVEQIAALPLGGRLRLDPWNNELQLVKAKPVSLLSAREKLPFEVTPVFIYLTRQKDPATAGTSSKNNN